MPRICGVYAIGLPDGRVYIGSSVDCAGRKSIHWSRLRKGSHHNLALQEFVNSEGFDGLTFAILARCEVGAHVQLEQELLDAHPEGFRLNIAVNAKSGMAGRRHDDATRTKMAIAKRGKAQPIEQVAKRAAALKGKVRTAEHKAAYSRAMSGLKKPSNTSGFCCVSPRGRKWGAYVRVGGKSRRIGSYATPELAYAMRLVYIAALPPLGG